LDPFALLVPLLSIIKTPSAEVAPITDSELINEGARCLHKRLGVPRSMIHADTTGVFVGELSNSSQPRLSRRQTGRSSISLAGPRSYTADPSSLINVNRPTSADMSTSFGLASFRNGATAATAY
jgi:hypothetical protein